MPTAVVPAALAAGKDRWKAVIRQVTTDPSRSARLSLAKLAGDAGDTRLAAIAASMLHDQDEPVALAAERSLVALSLSGWVQSLAQTPLRAFLTTDPHPELARGLAVGLDGTLEELLVEAAHAANSFGEHRRRAAVLSALILADRATLRGKGPGATAIKAWLQNTEHTSQAAARSILRWSRIPITRLRALEWLGNDHFSAAASDRLVKAQSLLEHELVLSQAHLLRRPLRLAVAARLKLQAKAPAATSVPKLRSAFDAPLPPSSAAGHLSPPARLGVIAFAQSLSAPAQHRLAVLTAFLADPIPSIRHAAMRAVPTQGLADFCFDAHEHVARSAMLSWSSAGAGLAAQPGPLPADRARLLSLLARSPHEAVRTWADQDLTAAPDPQSATRAGRLAALHSLATNRSAFLAKLRAALADDQLALQALMLARALRLVADLEPQILALTQPGTPPRLLATAVAALTEVGTREAATAAAHLLDHANDRVRANAVETLGHRRARSPSAAPTLSTLAELKSDPNHRVRANAIRIVAGDAIHDELTGILTDSRPMHRLAGMWLAGRTLPSRIRAGDFRPELLARISESARFDDDPRVRVRAAACSQRLTADLRYIWRSAPQEHHAQ
jgi:hypothetical protein